MTKRFIFQQILDTGIEKGFEPGKSEEAKSWFREQAGKIASIRPERVLKSVGARRNQVTAMWRPGEMYLFRYDPLNKDTLPYYDRFPLMMLIDTYTDGFLGINFHYLPPLMRASLMDKMYRFLNNEEFNDKTRLLLTYEKLKSLSGMPLYKPCIKRYLNSHVKSRFIKIHPAEWDLILMLPLDRFVKKRRNTVWIDSKTIYQGNA